MKAPHKTNLSNSSRKSRTIAWYCMSHGGTWQRTEGFLDPVVLLFYANKQDASTQLVALIQVKTYPSRDNTFFGGKLRTRKGTQIYKMVGTTDHLSAATIICSDAFNIDPVLSQLNYQSTLIHIQLNPSPTNLIYRQYQHNVCDGCECDELPYRLPELGSSY